MKSPLFPLAAVAVALVAALLVTQPTSNGQAGNSATDTAFSTLIAEVAAQQTRIAENQTKIDEKIAQVSEEVRQARLFVARGGGAKK
ncbi:hypothetical protein ACXR0O_16605 [Verrucomicrobiota bacterium sgz303538]